MDETLRIGARRAFFHSDLVVALKHVEIVARTLKDARVGFDEVERSEGLGLALLRLKDDADAAAKMADADAEVAASLRRDPYASPTPTDEAVTPGEDIDRFLRGLRARFAKRNEGWTPTLGKNRLVGQVIGGGKISHGGGSPPKAVKAAFPRRPETPGRGVRVGLLDTAISSQEWIAGGWVSAAGDVLSPKGPFRAPAGHATFITGLVLSKAPGCVVDVRQVLSNDLGESDSWTVAKAIVDLGRTRPDVMNLSFACYTEDGMPPLVLATALDRLHPDTVVVAAAGNHGALDPEPQRGDRRKPAWPAAIDGVVAVGAADGKGTPADFTPADVEWIDVLAPGVDAVSTFLDGTVDVGPPGKVDRRVFHGFAEWSGTSFSAALVSGAIASRTEPFGMSARQVWRDLRASARSAKTSKPAPPFLDLS
jgi:subtilisin family serine protease